MKQLLLIGLLLPSVVFAQGSQPETTDAMGNSATLSGDSVAHVSSVGNFRITFPAGCSRIVTKVPPESAEGTDGPKKVIVSITYCDRYQERGEGCSVSSFFNVTDDIGGAPGPRQVIDRVVRFLDTMNVSITKEGQLSKEMPDGSIIKGFEVFASESGGVAQAWVRGLLYQGNIYIVSAWKNSGQLWDDPEFLTFFNSFKPGTTD